MKLYLVTLFSAILSTFALPANAASPIQILTSQNSDETYHGEDVTDVHTGQQWFAIVPSGNDYIVKKVRVSVKSVRDEIIDNDNQKTGRQLTFKPVYPDVVYQVRGLPLKNGQKILGSHIQESSPDYSHASGYKLLPENNINIGNITLIAEATVTIEDKLPVIRNYVLKLKSDSYEETLFTSDFFDDNEPKLLWAGDLNGDGNADLLIDTSSKYSYSQPTLFLSQVVEGAVSYKKAAERQLHGC